MARRPVQSFRDFLVDLESVAVEWDESKRRANLVKHGFDFRDVVSLLPDAVISPARTVGGEERWMGINHRHFHFLGRELPADLGKKGARG